MKNVIKRAAAILLTFALLFTVQICTPIGKVHAAPYAVWPTEPKYKNITTYFNPQRNINDVSGYHNAIDIEAAGGSNIYAAYSGEVISADWKGAYGNMVIIYHADLGVYTFYAHASQLNTSAGAKVNQGDLIAKVGSTGESSGNHLHFGICNTLLGAYPARTYYDPLTYFVYSDNDGTTVTTPPASTEPECSCSEDCAGLYTTKNVVTYLNIRSDHSTNSSIVGSIPANAEFTVTKGDGKWAHVEFNGVKGYASMDYMQLKKANEPVESDMKIENVAAPEGAIPKGKAFSLKGVITSNLPITKVYGGVYFREGEATSQVAEAAPNAVKYDLATYFDKNIVFNALYDGEYTYKIVAEDNSGKFYELVKTEFTIGEVKPAEPVTTEPPEDDPPEDKPKGDLNGDGTLNVSDAVVLQSYLLKSSEEFSEEQYKASDMNDDGTVDVFDLIELKQAVVKATS